MHSIHSLFIFLVFRPVKMPGVFVFTRMHMYSQLTKFDNGYKILKIITFFFNSSSECEET